MSLELQLAIIIYKYQGDEFKSLTFNNSHENRVQWVYKK